ncbi:MAG: response regulator [Burkholderiales bacterium]
MKRVLLIDDHPIMLEAMKLALMSVLPEIEVQVAIRLDDAIAHALASEFDVAILDLTLPDAKELTALLRFKAEAPDLPVIVFSASSERATIIAALDAGAMGFIPKTAPSDVLLGALRLVFSGGLYVPSEVLAGKAMPEPQTNVGLTPRQLDVMQMLLLGFPNKRICRELGISENTVKVHVSAVLRALHAENRTQAVLNAVQLGIKVSPSSIATDQ